MRDDNPYLSSEQLTALTTMSRRYRHWYRQLYVGQFDRRCASCSHVLDPDDQIYLHEPTGHVAHVHCPQ